MTWQDDRTLLILYATETGNAQDAADYIARQCRRIDFTCRVMSVDAYSIPDLISEPIVIFVVATTGSGTEPRTMTPLWTLLLRSDLPPDLFEDMSFSVFGLGDSAYENFCWPAKKLERRLQSLGAAAICEKGEGDEQNTLGIESVLISWSKQLLDKLLELYPLPAGVSIIPESSVPPARVSLNGLGIPGDSIDNIALQISQTQLEDKAAIHPYLPFRVRENKRITAQDWVQDVRHLEFDCDNNDNYDPGDTMLIRTETPAAEVQTFLDLLGWAGDADTPMLVHHTFHDQSLPHLFSEPTPARTTLRSLFTHNIDFRAVPKRSFFQYLRYFDEDELEAERLDEFLSPEGSDELHSYVTRPRRTIYEVLTEFRHAKIPKEYIFDIFPPLRPREFSIASSKKAVPNEIHLCVAIVKYRTLLKVPRQGVCTTYLAALKPGDIVSARIQKSSAMQLPKDPKTPIICVGPGTGIAPMRALIQQRISNGAQSNTLYFGCRSASKDHHYASEWASAESRGLIYRAAFSRDGPEGQKRVYVQDLMVQDAQTIWEIVGKRRGWLYISGSSNKMPEGVKQAIREAAQSHGRMSETEAQEFVAGMVREGRLFEECWS
ncbi:riboflavin synthase domain-like protein [Infundibulicybe gibba]|nr:riboflavin synthase domain-like protein [Infundibulicybe gibba]